MIDELLKNLKNKSKIIEGKHSIVSSLSNEIINGPMRAWICGHFYPKSSVFHRNDVEICFKNLHKGMEEKLHYHLCSFEFLLVLSGKVEYDIDGDATILEPGMFYILYPGNVERIVKVHEDTTIIAVRLPSIPKNKIFTDEEK